MLLCRHHHRLVHEGGFGLRALDDGALQFTRSDGRGVPVSGSSENPMRAEWRDLVVGNRERGLEIDAGTGVTLWGGERMDYDIAIDGLMRVDGL